MLSSSNSATFCSRANRTGVFANVCQQNNFKKIWVTFLMKFGESVDCRSERNWLNFRRLVLGLYTVCLKKTVHSTFEHNFDKCRPIYKIISLSDFVTKFHTHTHTIKILCLTLSMFLHYLWNLKITVAADFNGILHVRPQNSSCKI